MGDKRKRELSVMKKYLKNLKKKIKKILKKIKRMIRKTKIYRMIAKAFRIIKKKIRKKYMGIMAKIIMKKSEIEPNKIAIATNTFSYTCNPKYIYEEMIRRRLNYKIVWLVNTRKVKKLDYPDNVRVIPLNSVKGLREVYSSKIWLDNGIVFSDYFDKKEGQLHIQTMHGSLGIKRLDNAVLCRNARGKSGQIVVQRESNETDYVITNSKFEEDVFHTVFWKNTAMVRLGHARTDILFSTNSDRITQIREELFHRYGIPTEKKLVLYAPTHRTGLTIENLSIDYRDMTEALQKKFGDEFAVMIRMHKRTKNIVLDNVEEDDKLEERVLYDVTNYPDIQELMLVTTIGITDYSSWIYDYVLTRRPGFIFATDLERYNTNTGLYYPLEETPFPVCKSHEQLIHHIEAFDYEQYLNRVEEFLKEKQSVDDGESAKRIVDWIQSLVPVK